MINLRTTIVGLLMLLSAEAALAVKSKHWRVTTAEEFLAGELDGMRVTSLGQLIPGARIEKLASFPDPFVLSQASDGSGTRFFGTGNEGRIYKQSGTNLTVLFKAPEPEVYALVFAHGTLYAGTSPNGKVYKINPSDGRSTVFFDPGQAYIWDLEVLDDGSFAVATGVEGKVFKVSSSGKGSVWFDAPETHARSLARSRGGKLLVGGSGEGRIYEVAPSGTGRAIHDSPFSEITALHFDEKTGFAWAAAVAGFLPSSAPPPVNKPASTTPSPRPEEPAADRSNDPNTPSASVEVSVSYEQPAAEPEAMSATAEMYQIHPDGYVEVVRRFEREIVYAITGAPEGGVYLSTGPAGRIYRYSAGEIEVAGTVPEKQVVSFSNEGASLVATTTNAGAVYRLDPSGNAPAEYRSAVKDAERFSRFGRYRLEGKSVPPSATMSFRSGNTSTPDDTWSPWFVATGPAKDIEAPAARYLQWKLNIPKNAGGVSVDAVTVSYINRNAAPVIDAVTVDEPGVVIVASNYPLSPQVLEATNPDEYGIFNSLENPQDRNEPGKRLFRKGFRTISWKARDPNGDSLRFNVLFRMSGKSNWLRLRENVLETQLNFDTSQLPDGEYEVKLIASDATDNAEDSRTSEKTSAEFIIDNAAPLISSEVRGDSLRITIADALSPVIKVEYSVDAERWIPLRPDDQITDWLEETFTLPRSLVQNRFLVIRAVDASFNVATSDVPERQ